MIALTNATSLSGDTRLIISLGSDIVSVENSLLNTRNLKSTLFVDTAVAAQIKLQAAKEVARRTAAVGTTAGLSAVLGISILNFDPSSLCNFMNTAELFYSLYLFNIELYPVLSGFLIGMRVESSLPNVFTYFISPSQGVTISDQYQEYGFKTNLVMLNVGVRFSVLILFILIGLLLRILSTIGKDQGILQELLKLFKYGVFLRFWVQLFFELLTASIIGMRYYDLNTTTQCIDLIVAFFILVINT